MVGLFTNRSAYIIIGDIWIIGRAFVEHLTYTALEQGRYDGYLLRQAP